MRMIILRPFFRKSIIVPLVICTLMSVSSLGQYEIDWHTIDEGGGMYNYRQAKVLWKLRNKETKNKFFNTANGQVRILKEGVGYVQKTNKTL